jgi:hypothetical protein
MISSLPSGNPAFRLSNARKKWNSAGKDVVVLHKVNFRFPCLGPPRTDVMVFKIFSKKNRRLDSKQSLIMQKFYPNIVFLRRTPFFAENCRKSQKIVIISSTPSVIVSAFRSNTKVVRSNPGWYRVAAFKEK